MRWTEEVELLQEEMHQILAFLDWQAQWWEEQGAATFGDDPATTRGRVAYAGRQAALRRTLRDSFQATWADIPRFLRLYDSWKTA